MGRMYGTCSECANRQQAVTEEADEPIRNLLKHIAELIVEEKLDSASLDIGNGESSSGGIEKENGNFTGQGCI